MLEISEVSRRFGGLHAVCDLSLKVPAGRVTGLIGPNGAGKTTIINLITGLLALSGGTVRFNEQDIGRLQPYEIARLGIARTFQNIRLLKEETVLTNVVAGAFRHDTTQLWQRLLGLPAVWRQEAAFATRGRALLAGQGMGSFCHVEAGALSYGDQRRVELVRALMLDPSLILLDEPVAGMNDVEAASLGRTMKALAANGKAVLLVEHNMKLVMDTCEYIYVVSSGRLITEGPPGVVQVHPAVVKAYLGASNASG